MSKIEVRMVEVEKWVKKREKEKQKEGRVSSREKETRRIYSVGSERESISMRSAGGGDKCRKRFKHKGSGKD